jgi:hypothetical protein
MTQTPEKDYYTELRATVLDDNAEVRSLFEKHLGPEVNEALLGIASGYRGYRELEDKVVLDERAAYLEAHAFTALNSLITSTHLLVSGMIAPSGNMMRQNGGGCRDGAALLGAQDGSLRETKGPSSNQWVSPSAPASQGS